MLTVDKKSVKRVEHRDKELEKKAGKRENSALGTPEYLSALSPLANYFTAQGPSVHSAPTVGSPNDNFEKHADDVADAVEQDSSSLSSPVSVRNSSIPNLSTQNPSPVGANDISSKAKTLTPPDPGKPINDDIRQHVEPVLGADISQVRVHDSPDANRAAESLHAKAFTNRNHIWLGKGQRVNDKKLIAHEAAHTVQQNTFSHSPGIQRQAEGGSYPVGAGEHAEDLTLVPEDAEALPDLDTGDLSSVGEGEEDNAAESDSESPETENPETDESQTEELATEATDESEETTAGGEAGSSQGEGGGASVNQSTSAEGDALGILGTGELALIDEELAEHQRWAGAMDQVGAAGSVDRAEFIAEAAGGGFLNGMASGAAMGLGMGLVGRAAARFVPIPGVGSILAGGMSAYGLATRDWGATGATISNFGEGSSDYEVLANSIASIAEIIDVVTNVLNVIAGIIGIISAVMWMVTVATVGLASPLAATLSSIALGITAVTGIMDGINAGILQPCVALFRSLHTFTSDADPREVQSEGAGISAAAGAAGGALGALAGGRLAEAGGGRGSADSDAPHGSPEADAPVSAASGDGPSVHYESGPAPDTGAPTSSSSNTAEAPAGFENSPQWIQNMAARGAANPDAPAWAQRLASPDNALNLRLKPVAAIADNLSGAGARTQETEADGGGVGGRRPEVEPDLTIEGDFSDASLNVFTANNNGPAQVGDIAAHQHQGARGTSLQSEHVIPGAQMRDGSVDPSYGAPDVRRHNSDSTARTIEEAAETPRPSDGSHYNNATTIIDHASVSRRKDLLDAQARAARPDGPIDPAQDQLLPSLERHQQATDQAIQAGDIRPQEATDPTHRALAAMTEMWDASSASGHAMARADADTNGTSVSNPRRPDRRRAAEAARSRDRLAQEDVADFNDYDWDATFSAEPSGPVSSVSPDVVIEGDFSDASINVLSGNNDGSASIGDIGLHRHQGNRGSTMQSEHVIPGADMRDASFDPSYNAPDWQRHTTDRTESTIADAAQRTGDSSSADYAGLTTMVENAAVSGHKDILDNAATRALQERGGPINPVEDHLIPSLERHQQATDMAIANQEITPAQASDPTHRALAAMTEMWDAGASSGAAKQRADAEASGTTVSNPRRPDRRRAAEAARVRDRLAEEDVAGFDDYDWDATFQQEPSAPTTPSQSTPAPTAPFTAAYQGSRNAERERQNDPSQSTARQVGAMFLPQLFGPSGKAPTHEQQQAAHNARFTDDNQASASAPGVERVNPNYSPPPGTPQQLEAIQQEIENLFAARAQAEQAERSMETQEADVQANQAPIQEAVTEMDAAVSATQAHQEAVTRRQQLNQEQQQRQSESAGLISGYPSRIAGASALMIPLGLFKDMSGLLVGIRDPIGSSARSINRDTTNLQNAFLQMDTSMSEQDEAGPAKEQALASDAETLTGAGEEATESQQQLEQAGEGAQNLQQENEEKITEAGNARAEAQQQGSQLDNALDTKQGQAQSLSTQLQVWAQEHKDARSQAIEQTVQQLEADGFTGVQVSEN